MTDTETFDAYCNRRGVGTRFEASQFPPEVGVEYGRYLVRVRSLAASALPRLLRTITLYADFVNNPAFNATAVKLDGKYLIVVYAGVPVIVSAVVNRMLADPRLFTHVGNPAEEDSSLPLFTQFKPDAAKIAGSGWRPVAPKNVQRAVYAHHLSCRVFDFLAAHEMAHIASGHLDYMEAERGMPYVEEIGWLPGTPEGNLELQAMEMDADFSAAYPLVTTIKSVVAERSTLPQPLADLYQDPGQAIFDLGAAVCILCRLFGDSRITGVDLSRKSHPPMRWRQRMILNTLGNYIEQAWDASLYSVAEREFSRALGEVENAFELVTGLGQMIEGLHDVFGAAGLEYAAKVAHCWNTIVKPKMERYKLTALSEYHFPPTASA